MSSSILSKFLQYILKLRVLYRLHFQDILWFWELRAMQLVQKFYLVQLQVAICNIQYASLLSGEVVGQVTSSASVTSLSSENPVVCNGEVWPLVDLPIVLLHWWWFSWYMNTRFREKKVKITTHWLLFCTKFHCIFAVLEFDSLIWNLDFLEWSESPTELDTPLKESLLTIT